MGWWFAEALLAIPSQIVESDKCSICYEDHIQITVSDNDIIRSLDNFHQWTAVVPGRERFIVSMYEDLKSRTERSAYLSNMAKYSYTSPDGASYVRRERLLPISLTHRSARSANLPVDVKRSVKNLLHVGAVKVRLIEALW